MRKGVEGKNLARRGRELARGSTVCPAVLIEVLRGHKPSYTGPSEGTHLNQLVFAPAGTVRDRLLGTLGEKLERRKAAHVVTGCDRLVVGGVGVHLSDNAIRLRRECLGDFLVGGLHVLWAVNTGLYH